MRTALIIGFIVCLGSTARAEENKSWSLAKFIETTLEKSDTVEEQKLTHDKAGYAVDEKRAAFLPTINATASAQTQNNVTNSAIPNSLPSSTGSVENTTNTKLNLTQNLYNGQDLAKLRAAKFETKQNRLTLTESKRAQIEDAIKAFFALLEDQSDLQNQMKELEFNQKNLKETEARIKIGNARQTEAINLQATIAGNQTDIVTTRADLEQQRETVRRLLKAETTAPIEVAYGVRRFKLETVDSVFSEIDPEKRADYQAQKAYSDAQLEYLSAAKGTRLPSVDLSANYFLTDSERFSQQGQYTVGLTLTVPLPFGMEKTAQIAQAKKTFEIAKRQEIEKASNLERDKNQLIKTIQSNIDQLKSLTNAKDIGESNVAALKSDHQIGLSTYTEVLNAFTSYQQTVRKLDRAYLEFELNCYRAKIWSASEDRLLAIFNGEME